MALAGALAGCQAAGPAASGPLGLNGTGFVPPSPAATPGATPTEPPDDDTPDEDEPSNSPPAASSPASGITGTWAGLWQNDEQWGDAAGGFTLMVVQHGSTFDGTINVTGPTCIRQGTVSGTLTGSAISMGVVAATVRDVNYTGTLSGDGMSGTWTAIACNVETEISGSWSAQRR